MLLGLTTTATYRGLFGDLEIAELLCEAREIAAMVEVERALARVQGRLGVIPEAAAQQIDAGLKGFVVNPEALERPTAAAGVPVPGLLAQLRRHLPAEAALWLHWGATSQDILDTATMLQMRECLDILAARLGRLLDLLETQSAVHGDLVMAGRTRSRVATPITFGLKLAQWAQPLIEAEAALPRLRANALRVQFGGASGANTAVAPHGPTVAAALAAELGLADCPPWHTARGPVQALSAWLHAVAAGMARIGGDLVLLGRSEIGEVQAGAGGGSSTMPQKANPVAAEAMVTLGRLAAQLHGGLAAAAAPAEERDGAVWALEWMLLPQLAAASGAALRHGIEVAETLRPDPEAMARTLASHPGVMAEAASLALAARHGRAEAEALVRDALAARSGFAAALADREPALDWAAILDPASVIPACRDGAQRILRRREVDR